jgi:hypothetical protein
LHQDLLYLILRESNSVLLCKKAHSLGKHRLLIIGGNFMEKVAQSIEKIKWLIIEIYDWLEQYWRPWLRIPGSATRWILITLIPIIFGLFLEDAVKQVSQNLDNLSIWLAQWPVIVVAFIYILVLLWQRYHNYQTRHTDRLYSALKWFYNEMKFADNVAADYRCTIWVPDGRHDNDPYIRLQQAVDYMPRFRSISPGKYSENGRAGRIFRVSHKVNGSVQSVGILGRCAVKAINNHIAEIIGESLPTASIPDKQAFHRYMEENWHFTRFHSSHLTDDRRAYKCLPMMDQGLTHLLGVLYIDARQEDSLPETLDARIEEYLPRFADLLTN